MKTYTIRSHHSTSIISSNDHIRDYTGTIDELCTKVFGYTLECGHSWNSKIPLRPKTAKSLVKALNDSCSECRRYSDWFELVK